MSKNYVDYMVEETKNILAIDSPSGYTKEVADYVMGEYKKLGYEPKLTVKGGVLVPIGGRDKENAVLLEAHIDTLGAMVAEIKANGRLRVTAVGGMNANNAEGENCKVVTRFNGKYDGTLQLINASIHVNGEYNDTKRSYDSVEVVLDEKVKSKEDVEKLGIMTGDFPQPFHINGKCIILNKVAVCVPYFVKNLLPCQKDSFITRKNKQQPIFQCCKFYVFIIHINLCLICMDGCMPHIDYVILLSIFDIDR